MYNPETSATLGSQNEVKQNNKKRNSENYIDDQYGPHQNITCAHEDDVCVA
jgi:hypothetical protein